MEYPVVGMTSNLAAGVVVPIPTKLLGEMANTAEELCRTLLPVVPLPAELKDSFNVGAVPSQALVQALKVSQLWHDWVAIQVWLVLHNE